MSTEQDTEARLPQMCLLVSHMLFYVRCSLDAAKNGDLAAAGADLEISRAS